MKRLLILLAIGLVASEKLDRTYLPPPGAKFSGGSPGAIQTPLELPKETYQSSGTLVTDAGLPTLGDSLIELGISRGQPEFGQVTTNKAPFAYYSENVPTTTTSYAFSQTTTLPTIQTYGTTVGIINPTTGLPEQYFSNLGNSELSSIPQTSFNQQGQRQIIPSVVNTNRAGIEGQIVNRQPSYNQENQLLGQYQDQYPITVIPGGNIQSGSVYQLPSQEGLQYTIGQNVGKVFIPSTATPQVLESFQIDSNNFGSNALPVSPSNSQPTYDDNKYQQGISSQYSKNQDSRPISGDSNGPPGSSSPEYFNQPSYSSTTPLPSISSTELTNFGSYVRPERPQSEVDRNAVIINFENERTPNGYSYSYDTSNGIHADESGIIDNGTKAKGGYSYIGDDGKVYSVTYTADENGFRPHGDHLPTPPPIPEAIQKVIEQVAREKQAGISDDGSYDEEKYGDMKYQGKINRYTSPNQGSNQFGIIDRSENNKGKPVSKLGDFSNEQNEGARPTQFNNGINVNGYMTNDLANIPPRGISNPVDELNQTGTPMSDTEENRSSERYSPKTEGSTGQPGQQGTKLEYPESQTSYVEPGRYFESDANKTPVNIGSNLKDINNNGIKFSNRPAKVSLAGSSNLSGNPQTFVEDNQRLDSSQRPVASYIKYTKPNNVPENSFVQNGSFNVLDDRRPGVNLNIEQPDAKLPTPNQRTGLSKGRNEVNVNGYTYSRPQIQFEQNRFPTRFRGQETMQPEEYGTTQGTTSKPFMTPSVYNKKVGTQPSFARKPFEVILPATESYNDYTDDNDYSIQKQGAERFGSTELPVDKISTTKRPDLSKQSTRPYNYTPDNKGPRVTQRVAPESKTTNFSISSTTPLPSQSSHLGVPSTQKSRTQYNNRPNPTVSGSVSIPSTEVPSISGFIISQSKGPVGYSATNSVTNSAPTTTRFGTRLPTANRVIPQSYSTTYKPVDYSATTVRPGFDSSSSSPMAYQMSYQYGTTEPVSSYGNVATFRPVPIPAGPGMYSQVAPGSTYQYGPVDYSPSTIAPVTGRTGSNFQTATPQASPTVSYQVGYQYGPGLQSNNGILTPGSSTSGSATTPQTYSSSTYRPNFVEKFTERPVNVDNFGRPINSEITYYPGYSRLPSYADSNRARIPVPVSNKEKVPGSTDSNGNSTYPGYGTTERVIGEDFSGPKQPQRYDSKTGYHY